MVSAASDDFLRVYPFLFLISLMMWALVSPMARVPLLVGEGILYGCISFSRTGCLLKLS
jgi:hypothetical protein